MSKYFSLTILLIVSLLSSAQVAVGQWRDHLPYTYGMMVADGNDKVYVVTNVGMYSYNKNNSEIDKMSKIKGLSDVHPTAVEFNKDINQLVIGYSNGNLDIIDNNTVYNIADIKRKSITADKRINHILFVDNFAYLSCGFGIVVYDMERKEIKNTYYIGSNGAYIAVNELTTDGQNLFAATEQGIYMGNMSDNLVDFSFWEEISDLPFTHPMSSMQGQNFNTIEYFNDRLIANIRDIEGEDPDFLVMRYNNEWMPFDTTLKSVHSLWSNGEKLTLTSDWYIKLYDTEFDNYLHIWKYFFSYGDATLRPNQTIIGDNDIIWIADKYYGLVRSHASWSYEPISINGPKSNNIFDMDASGKKLWGVAGGFNLSLTPRYTTAMMYGFENEWETIDLWSEPDLSGVTDLVTVVIDPQDPNHVFAGSWVYGLVEFRNNELIELYDETNSPLQTIPSTNLIRIGGLDFDNDNNLWMSCSDNEMPILVKMDNGNWYGLDYKSEMGVSNVGELIVTSTGQKWVVLPRGGGLFVLYDNGTPEDKSDDDYRKLSIYDEYGEIISNEVFSIAEDLDGSIWVGTNKGVVVYYNPEDVFDQSDFYGQQIKIPRNDGSDDADLLLGAETITAIAVDGANNKWFGTQSGGVFMTSDDGIKQVHHFNIDNSPILSNNIYCISIVPETGEVFIGTEMGLISYRGEATEGEDDFDQVYAFPNPVKPDYSGPITIHGLLAGSYVKITDISGNIVFEMRSQGGQAIWQGTDFDGNRVKTGVYLVFASNEDGSKKTVTKILFIN